MSDSTQCDRVLLEMREEIISRHLKFLEAGESGKKIEERNKLEDCLKQFLCVVPQDRKFTLPETRHVLRKSIYEINDFSADKAITAFEAISQFANNLVQKPWSREFRVIKTYSGFFKSKVNKNLLDAEKLFEAMGYRRTTDEIFVLDGSICPQQVRSVSLDAMAAYLECQIIKNIYDGLTSIRLLCSWKEVFDYRENNIGGHSECTRGLAHAIHERQANAATTGCAKSSSAENSNLNASNDSDNYKQKQQPSEGLSKEQSKEPLKQPSQEHSLSPIPTFVTALCYLTLFHNIMSTSADSSSPASVRPSRPLREKNLVRYSQKIQKKNSTKNQFLTQKIYQRN